MIFKAFVILIPFLCSVATLAKNVGVYGGTFDPPHAGHVVAIEAAKEAGNLDEVIVVVSNSKSRKSGKLDYNSRRELAAAQFGKIKGVRFLTEDEYNVYLDNQYNGFVEKLSRSSPHDNFYLISGSDVIENISKGTFTGVVESNVSYLGIVREGETIDSFGSVKGQAIVPKYSTSSTSIRKSLLLGEAPKDLDKDVIDLILKKHTDHYKVTAPSCGNAWEKLLKTLN